jgi:hypothetical protein
MISTLIVSALVGAGPGFSERITGVRRAFLEDGADRVSATSTHRVISRADGSFELQGTQPLRLWLQSISRESGPSCQTSLLSREFVLGETDTVRTRHRCEVEESWRNEAAGLAHGFTVFHPPAGSGALTLRLAIDGPWHHQDARGHVFKGPGASAALRYGNAFVVRGSERLPIEVVRVENGLELRISAALVEAEHAFPMIIDPLLSAEVELDPSFTFGPSAAREESPALAVNAAGVTMVVWVDTRRQAGADLFGARFTTGGTLLDPAGIPISAAAGHQFRPTLCADGNTFVVAWDTPLPDGGSEVKLRPVTAAGVPGAEVLVGPGSQPSLASTGDAGSLLLAMVDPSSIVQVVPVVGTTVGTVITRPASDPGIAARPFIAASNRSWFVAWESAQAGASVSSIHGMASGAAGPVVSVAYDNAGLFPARRPTVALGSLAANDVAYVFWGEGLTGANGIRINPAGPPLNYAFVGSSPAVVRTSSALGAQPTLGSFVGGRLQLLDLNDGGLSSFGVGPSPGELVLALGDNNQLSAAWTESPGVDSDVYGAPITGVSAANTQGLLLSRAANAQRGARVAMSGPQQEGLAVWLEGTDTLWAAKVRDEPNGLRVGSPFKVASSALTIERVELAAAADQRTFLITWKTASPSSIIAQLASTSSTQGLPFVISGAGVNAGPAVAWDQGSSKFVVAWNQAGPAMMSRAVSVSGVADPPDSHAMGAAVEVALTCLRTRCLLAWESTTREVKALVIGSLTSPVITRAPAAQPAVAHDGTNFFLGWRAGAVLAFARFDFTSGDETNLQVGPPATSAGAYGHVSMAPGNPPVVAWAQLAGDVSSLFLQRLDFQGPATFVAEGTFPSLATVVGPGEPAGVVVYQRFLDDSRFNAVRSYAKSFSFTVDGGTVDGGSVDGGTDAGFDAGVTNDDGGLDAGTADGGVMVFETAGCPGCQSVSVTPLLLLALAWSRRRQIKAS